MKDKLLAAEAEIMNHRTGSSFAWFLALSVVVALILDPGSAMAQATLLIVAGGLFLFSLRPSM